jgi:putative transposase
LANITGSVNNNIVEKLHGTIRERNKVMRGLGNNGSSETMLEGFKIYYNFLRPHMGLNGLTPAEAAGIDIGLNDGNRWLKLIRKSTNHDDVSGYHSLED